MIYISVYVTLEESANKWAKRKMAPGGLIVLTDDDGDSVYFKYTRGKLLELARMYYMNPECSILVDPYIVGISKNFERYAHQELGFVIGVAMSNKLNYKILYKLSYFRYFGLLASSESAAYGYCLANYPSNQMLYKFKDEVEANRACCAYLMTRFMEAKRARQVRWDNDIQHILEELDDATADCDLGV